MTLKEPQDSILYQTGCVVILTIAACYMLATLGFAAGISLSPWTFPAAFVTAFAIVARPIKRDLIYTFLLSAGIIILALAATFPTEDHSWDGNAYHQETIAWLMQGWNPVHRPNPGNYLSIWGRCYAKGSEIVCAATALSFGRLEYGRAVNWMFILSTLLMAYPTVRQLGHGVSRTKAAAVSIFAAANPVGIAQATTYYTDSPKYYIILAIIIVLRNIFIRHSLRKECILCALLILGTGIKFNIAPELALTMVFAITLALIRKQKGIAERLVCCSLIALAGGIFVFGYNPYVTNTIIWKNPLYPLMGDGSIDIMTGNTPEIYLGKNRVQTFLYSLTHTGGSCFTYYASRIGGFTIIMPFLLTMSLIGLAANIKKIPSVYSAIAITALLSCFLFEQSWWARYQPQLWLVPSITIAALSTLHTRRAAIISTLMFIGCIMSSYLSVLSGKKEGTELKEYRKEIFSKARERGVLYVSDVNLALKTRAREEGVRLIVVSKDSPLWRNGYHRYYDFNDDEYAIFIRCQ